LPDPLDYPLTRDGHFSSLTEHTEAQSFFLPKIFFSVPFVISVRYIPFFYSHDSSFLCVLRDLCERLSLPLFAAIVPNQKKQPRYPDAALTKKSTSSIFIFPLDNHPLIFNPWNSQ